MHVLEQVRVAVVAALNGLPTTGPRVYVKELHSWAEQSLPSLLVTTSCAPVREQLDAGMPLRWDPTITVTAIVKGTGDLPALLDDIATEVAGALCVVDQVGGKTVEIVPTALDAPEPYGEGDQGVMRRTMTFVLQSLYTLAAAPDTLLD